MVLIVLPRTGALSPLANREFVTNVMPSVITFIESVSGATVVFGLALLYVYYNGNLSSLPLTISVGGLLGALAFVTAVAFTAPTFRKIVRIVQSAPEGTQGPPSSQLLVLMRRSKLAGLATVALLFMTVVFMVAAAFV